MSSRPTRTIAQSLVVKGFEKVATHHEMYWLKVGEKKASIRTRISNGAREYDDNLLGQMAKQLKLSKKQLLELIDCPMSREDYLDLLVQAGVVRLDAAEDREASSGS